MADKTIKELAEELGVGKTAINKKVSKENRKLWFSKNGNKFVINDSGQKAIRVMFGVKNDNSEHKPVSEISTTETPKNTNQVSESELISLLEKQLNQKDIQLQEKDIQLQEKDNQIKQMQELLDQQQQLTLQANQQIEKLQLTYTEEKKNNKRYTTNYQEKVVALLAIKWINFIL